MGEALLESFNRCIFVVGPARPFQKTKQQDPGAALFTDSQPDGSEHNAKGGLAFALSFTVVDVQPSMVALNVSRRDDADALWHGSSSYRWSLQRSFRFTHRCFGRGVAQPTDADLLCA